MNGKKDVKKGKSTDKSTDVRLKNLKPPWKKGATGNPKGFSKKAKQRVEFKQWIDENYPDGPAEVFKVLFDNAKKGRDFRFVDAFLDRYQGRVPQKNELTGKDGNPLEVKINVLSTAAQKRIDELRKKLSGEP